VVRVNLRPGRRPSYFREDQLALTRSCAIASFLSSSSWAAVMRRSSYASVSAASRGTTTEMPGNIDVAMMTPRITDLKRKFSREMA
jgi:hypothetical protein